MTETCQARWAAVAFWAVLSPGVAWAYDAPFTHRWLTRNAVATLVHAYPGEYDEALAYVDTIADGAEAEDDIFLDGDIEPMTLRVQRHFYRPTDRAGLFMDDREFESSFLWGAVPNEQNIWGYDDGLAHWQGGDRDAAYLTLGHVVHLIQDLTVPAHTHLDIHGPPKGDDYEAYCSSQMTSELISLLPRPASNARPPTFATLAEAWDKTARTSYWRNMYSVDLQNHEAPTGQVPVMFPSLAWGWFGNNWSIDDPEVGSLGTDFLEESPGWIYFKDTEHAALSDRVAFDAKYPESVSIADNDDGTVMAANMARDLVPVAILHSAAVMKMYIDRARDLPPTKDDPPPPITAPDAVESCAAGGTRLGSLVLLLALGLIRRRR